MTDKEYIFVNGEFQQTSYIETPRNCIYSVDSGHRCAYYYRKDLSEQDSIGNVSKSLKGKCFRETKHYTNYSNVYVYVHTLSTVIVQYTRFSGIVI